MYNSQILAERIAKKIKEKTTISKALEELGIAKNSINNLKKSNDKDFSLKSLVKIAEYTNCSIDYLLGWTDTPQADIRVSSGGQDIYSMFDKLSQSQKEFIAAQIEAVLTLEEEKSGVLRSGKGNKLG